MKKQAPRTPVRHRTNEQWSQATSASLRQQARVEFTKRGYADSSLERIARHATVTKGAIYYHFRSKEGLFEAVFRDVQLEMTNRIHAVTSTSTNPVEAVVNGSISFLETAVDDSLRQIALVDGPLVLGWSRWRAIDSEFALGALKDGLRDCVSAGHLRGVDINVLAHLISGAVNEGVFVIAEADNRAAAFAAVSRSVVMLVRRVLVSKGSR